MPAAPIPDTEVTPTPKDGCASGWLQVAGDVFPGAQGCGGYKPASSPVSPTVDFFSVSFHDENAGFAAGAVCKDDLPSSPPSGFDRDAFLRDCQRMPVIYRYTPGQSKLWQRMSLPGEDRAGFVGAIAWIGKDRALAVGGSGVYPRREQPAGDPQPDRTGAGRAWLYDHGSWQEIDLAGKQTTDSPPRPMGGLTALDCTPYPETDGEFCVAGGWRQLWMWHGTGSVHDDFTKSYTDASPDSEFAGQTGFRFRVKAIGFLPAFPDLQQQYQGLANFKVVATTTGCCDGDATTGSATTGLTTGTPRVLLFEGTRSRWWSETINSCHDKDYSVPDSYISLVVSPSIFASSGTFHLSVLASPGGPHSGAMPQPASTIIQSDTFGDRDLSYLSSCGADPQPNPGVSTPPVSTQVTYPTTRAGRFVAGAASAPDGVMDWAVGALADGGQAAAFTTTQHGTLTPSPTKCPAGTFSSGYNAIDSILKSSPFQAPSDPANCKSDPNFGAQSFASSSLLSLPSYALNAVTFAQGAGNATGSGWAVGDRGAIDVLTVKGSLTGGEGRPPTLGAPTPGALSNTQPYDAFRPPSLTSDSGLVPALGAGPAEQLAAPGFFAGGSPDYTHRQALRGLPELIASVVMSRDGSEGWAIGPGKAQQAPFATTTLWHFDGLTWTRCDTDGIPGVLPADPQCAQLAELVRYHDTLLGGGNGVPISVLARVPMENGADSSKANDFELVAVGGVYKGSDGIRRNVVLRYRDHHWSIDNQAMKEINTDAQGSDQRVAGGLQLTDVAFTAPDDGWILATQNSWELFHFHDGHWTDCDPNGTKPVDSGCDSPDNRLVVPASAVVPVALTTVGRRVYLYGARDRAVSAVGIGGQQRVASFPLIMYHDGGKQCDATHGEGCWRADRADGGFDPLFDNPQDVNSEDQGSVSALSVVQDDGGQIEGWAAGTFGQNTKSPLLHLAPGTSGHRSWQPWPMTGVLSDHGLGTSAPDSFSGSEQLVALAGHGGRPGRALFHAVGFGNPLLSFDPGHERWGVQPTPFPLATGRYHDDIMASIGPFGGGSQKGGALAPDGHGGAWVQVQGMTSQRASDAFYHYTDLAPQPVFQDMAHPVRELITAAAGGPDGSFWVATTSNVLYRYDRLTGWDRVPIPGWDPGRVVTKASEATAIAVGAGGRGVVVGKDGRIADIGPGAATLDGAAGTVLCSADPGARPCGTSRTLRAAAVAPQDGSAIVGGDRLALLWRPAGDVFRAVAKPDAALGATISGLSLPRPDRAYLTTSTGQVFRGQLSGSDWQWTVEDTTADGVLLTTKGVRLGAFALRAIAVDASGHGFAVGEHGVILERSGDSDHPWRRLATGLFDDYFSVALPSTGQGRGALVGGRNGLVLTFIDGRFYVANQVDPYDPVNGGLGDATDATVPGVALLPGARAGQVEAWAALQLPDISSYGDGTERIPRPNRILHYTSDPSDPLLRPGERVKPLPDSAAPRPGETAFAAFGKSECRFGVQAICAELTGTNIVSEQVATRVTDEILDRSHRPGGPQFAVFTGDVNDKAGNPNPLSSSQGPSDPNSRVSPTTGGSPADPSLPHRRFAELVASRLVEAGTPVFGAVGSQDLFYNSACRSTANGDQSECVASTSPTKAGASLGWREAFGAMPAPWGSGDPAKSADGLVFDPAPGSAKASSNTSVSNPSDGSTVASVPTGGANTHYAFDVKRDGKALARVIFLDSSHGSLSGSDPGQAPSEAQLAWLKSVLCESGQQATPADHCRDSGEQAIVVSETPTYSYGPGAGTDTATDGTALEALLYQYHANLVVSGHLGWNALYWTTAPGLHSPCAGGDYPDYHNVPDAQTAPCGASAGATPQPPDAAAQLANGLTGVAAPGAPAGCSGSGDNATGVIPNVVASSAGGKFGPDGSASGSASQGYWHGYTIVRLDRSGDPHCTIVEQRPVFDWVGISAVEHTLRPGQHMTLRGYGREPVGLDQPFSYDDINSLAITHRYDLLKADPAKPYLPATDCPTTTDNPQGYCPLADPGVASIDPSSGVIQTGKGNHSRVYAIGLLSVGDKAASWPIAFEPRRSFRPPPAPAPHVPALLAPRVLAAPVASLPNVQPPPNPPPLSFTFPTPPQVPSLPPLSAPATRPPTPPVPPPPPANASPSALNIAPAAVGLNVAPPATVIPPPAPPIQPAPPGGARREARQRQAAAAKSEEGAQQAPDAQVGGDSLANAPEGADHALSRRDRIKPGVSITMLAHRDQPSAWARGALYGGGLTLMALTLAFGYTTLRPGPRRRRPELPAPAWVRQSRR